MPCLIFGWYKLATNYEPFDQVSKRYEHKPYEKTVHALQIRQCKYPIDDLQ